MHHAQSRPISEHRLARIIAWLGALLGWLALGVSGEDRHRRRQVGIEKLRRGVRNIIIIRAAELLTPPKPTRLVRPGVPIAVRGRRRRLNLRSIAGVWLRKRLIVRGDFVTQVKHLLAALRQLRTFAAQLAYRRRRSLTRGASIFPSRPPAAQLATASADLAANLDTS